MRDFRDFITECEKNLPREFVRVTEEVDPRYEISAIVKRLDMMHKTPLLLFENVKGFKTPVVINTDSSRTKLGLALRVAPAELEEFYNGCEEEAMHRTAPPVKVVNASEAPCKEVVKTGKDINLFDFPFLTHHEDEVPYLTKALGIVMHEKAKCPHLGCYRLMVKGPDLGVTHITPGRHLWDLWRDKYDKNLPLEIAFVLGVHPAWTLAAQSRIGHPPSEFDVAAALLRESVPVVPCETIDVLVPASAEIVIEGVILPNELEDEGPWGDFTRYQQVDKRHGVKIKAITHRKNPIVHDMGIWVTAAPPFFVTIPMNAFMNRQLKQAVPDVKEFQYGGSPMLGLIRIDKKHAGQPKQAILAAFGNDLYLKYVICTDTDIDLQRGTDILWALFTRVQAERDIMVLPGVLGTDLDVSAPQESVLTKVGIDATAKPFRKDLPRAARVPDEVVSGIKLEKFITDLQGCM